MARQRIEDHLYVGPDGDKGNGGAVEAAKEPPPVRNRGGIIAERRLRFADFTGNIVARIYAPQPSNGLFKSWWCKIEVLGLDPPLDRVVTGTDGLDTLYRAVKELAEHLEPYESKLGFGYQIPGEWSLPIIVPWYYGAEQKAEMRGIIKAKTDEYAGARD